MNNQLTDTVKLLQKAALIHQGKVLVLKRSLDSVTRPGAWDLPGGNSEWPTGTQSLENVHREDITREIREETGIELETGQFTDDKLVFFMTYFDAPKQLYSVMCGWRIELGDGFDPASIVISDEHTEQAWIMLNELETYDFGEPVGTYIKTIIRNAYQRK